MSIFPNYTNLPLINWLTRAIAIVFLVVGITKCRAVYANYTSLHFIFNVYLYFFIILKVFKIVSNVTPVSANTASHILA